MICPKCKSQIPDDGICPSCDNKTATYNPFVSLGDLTEDEPKPNDNDNKADAYNPFVSLGDLTEDKPKQNDNDDISDTFKLKTDLSTNRDVNSFDCGDTTRENKSFDLENVTTKSAAKKKTSDAALVLRNFFSKNKKNILIVAAICLGLIITILLFSLGGPKSEKEIIADLPESVTTITINDELIPLKVKSLKIEKRKTQDGIDEVYCVIELASESITVTKYQQLIYVKYNGNKWILDWFDSYATEEVRILNEPEELYDWAIGRIEYTDDRYADIEKYITDYKVTVTEQEVSYTFDVSKKIGLMSIEGQITVGCSLYGDDYESYDWVGFPDDNAIQITLDVDGTWEGGMSNWGMGWYELTLNIESLTTEAITCTWRYDDDDDAYFGDSSDCWIIDSNDEMIEIGIQYGTSLGSYVDVTFYTDGTCTASRAFLGEWHLERQ